MFNRPDLSDQWFPYRAELVQQVKKKKRGRKKSLNKILHPERSHMLWIVLVVRSEPTAYQHHWFQAACNLSNRESDLLVT